MRSHTGGLVSFGTGGLICKSSKQKLNTKSSTEGEVVGASNYLPNALWVQMFMQAQGYPIGDQDGKEWSRISRAQISAH
jgi:hypothetical protein